VAVKELRKLIYGASVLVRAFIKGDQFLLGACLTQAGLAVFAFNY